MTREVRTGRRVLQLFTGLALYGISMAFMVESRLGLTSWDVFHQGVSKVTGLSFGWVVILAGIPILLLWIPLRQKPGFGTIANLVVIGFVVDGALAVLAPGESLAMRITYLVVGILLNGVATGHVHRGPLRPRPARRPDDRHRQPLAAPVHPAGPHRASSCSSWRPASCWAARSASARSLYALTIGPLAQLFIPAFAVKEPAAPRAGACPGALALCQ